MTGIVNYPGPSHDPVIVNDTASHVISGLAATAGPPSTNAPAGLAAATGNAPQPEATIAPNAGVPTGAGSAPQPEAGVSPNADGPTAAGTAPQPAAHVRVLAGVASATGDSSGTTVATVAGAAPPIPVVATGAAVKAAQDRYHRQPIPAVDVGPPLAVPETQAPAGGPTAAGSAPQPEAEIGVKPAAPTGAGEAPPPTVVTVAGAARNQPIVVTPAAQTALVLHRQATAQFVDYGAPLVAADTNAPAGLASGSGVAEQPEASLGVKPAGPTAAGTSAGTTVITGTLANAGVASGAGTANQPEAEVGAKPACPTGAGSAPQPTVTTSTSTNAPAGLAAATGTANTPEAEIGAKPNTPEAAGASSGTTVQTAAFANAPAGLASASGAANAATITIRPNAGVGLAAGVAEQPESSLGVKPGFGAGVGSAPQPTVTFGAIGFAGLASATGIANQPEADIKVLAGVGAATGEAGGVFALIGNPLGDAQGYVAVDDDHSLTARDHPVGLIAIDDDHSL